MSVKRVATREQIEDWVQVLEDVTNCLRAELTHPVGFPHLECEDQLSYVLASIRGVSG